MRAARALESYLLENTENTEVKVVDTLKEINTVLDKMICDGYHFLATKAPKVFGKLYEKTNTQAPFGQIVPKFNGFFSKKLMPLMEEFEPDVIITTHPFVNEMVSNLKQKGKIHAPLICIMTDYSAHQAWIADDVDAYVVSNEDMIPQMRKMGAAPDKIYPFGIPVHDVFFEKTDKAKLLEDMRLDPDVLTILVMAGSFGVNNIMKIYREIVRLEDPFQLIVITGKNEKLYEAFENEIQKSPKKTKLVCFTNEVEKYMHASDLLITKPGGLTVSEALACNIPLAVFDAIPGQEEDNANFLLMRRMAIKIPKKEGCAVAIHTLISDRQQLEEMRDSCRLFDKSKSNQNILSLINTLIDQSSGEVQR